MTWPGDGTKLLSGDGSQVVVGGGLNLSAGQLDEAGTAWPGSSSQMVASDGSTVTVGSGLSLSAGTVTSTDIKCTYAAAVGDTNVPLLLHMEGANNSTTFTSTTFSPKTVTAIGNAKISTAASKFGSASAVFDGNGDYLRIPYDADFNLSTTDFTYELWFNCNSFATSQGVLSKHTNNVYLDYNIYISNSTTINFLYSNSGTPVTATVPAMSTGTWYHLAVVKSSGNLSIYLNGTRYAGPTAVSIPNNITSNFVTIGCTIWNNPSDYFNGYIDEIRLSKIARYSGASFTVPSAAFTHADGSAELVANSVGTVVYSGDGVYVCTSLSPLTWKKFSIASTISF